MRAKRIFLAGLVLLALLAGLLYDAFIPIPLGNNFSSGTPLRIVVREWQQPSAADVIKTETIAEPGTPLHQDVLALLNRYSWHRSLAAFLEESLALPAQNQIDIPYIEVYISAADASTSSLRFDSMGRCTSESANRIDRDDTLQLISELLALLNR